MVGGVAGTGGVIGQTGFVAGSQKTVDHIYKDKYFHRSCEEMSVENVRYTLTMGLYFSRA